MTWGGLDRIATEAQQLMAQVEEEYGAHVKVGVVGIVVELNGEAEVRTYRAAEDVYETTTIPYTAIDWRCSDHRRWIQRALFDGAARSVGG